LVGLFLTASRESGAADELERLTELFRRQARGGDEPARLRRARVKLVGPGFAAM
jgi:hypothetical protein